MRLTRPLCYLRIELDNSTRYWGPVKTTLAQIDDLLRIWTEQWSKATDYDFPYSYRPYLQGFLSSTVTKNWASIFRVSSDQTVASDVEYVDSKNAASVILSGGPWGSPPILERSIVRNTTLLSSLGIQTVVDLRKLERTASGADGRRWTLKVSSKVAKKWCHKLSTGSPHQNSRSTEMNGSRMLDYPDRSTGIAIKASSKHENKSVQQLALHTSPANSTPVKMFARLSAAVLLALPLFAVAQTSCSTEKQQCCNSVQDAKSSGIADIVHSLLGVALEDVTAQVGLTCTPISVLAISGVSCNQQTVCCENNNFNGLVALGCTPINLNL
ncbi:hypothetical protein H0H93_003281 [Arthromyces matolae]|nr:hypothetical protein H0H93_003281 [Arthromyces matolae]